MSMVWRLSVLTWTLMLVGCAIGPGEWSDAIGREWTLTKLDGNAPLDERTPTLTLSKEGRAAGLSGGNRFFGTYETPAPGEIQFASLGSTKMYIDDPPGLMEQETQYLSALSEVDAYRVSPGRLVLLSSSKPRLIFTAKAADE